MVEKEFDRVKLNPISTNQLSSLIVGEEGLPKNVGQAGDPELNYLTEGNIPISEAEMKTREIRNKFGTMKDEILDGFWDSVKGGAQNQLLIFIIMDLRGPPESVQKERAQKAQAGVRKNKIKRIKLALFNEEKLKKPT